MKMKAIAVLSAVVIAAGSMGVIAFAANAGTVSQEETKPASVNQKNISNNNGSLELDVQAQKPEEKNKVVNPGCASNPSKKERGNMIKIMRENGFKDAARYMQTGDYKKMHDLMNNLSEEDFQKMLEIMKDNGYEAMAKMMESMGREAMIKMHNSMGSMHGEAGMSSMHTAGSGMMGRFASSAE